MEITAGVYNPTVGNAAASWLVHRLPPALGQSTTPTRLPGTPDVSLPADPDGVALAEADRPVSHMKSAPQTSHWTLRQRVRRQLEFRNCSSLKPEASGGVVGPDGAFLHIPPHHTCRLPAPMAHDG
jgi:hypothetical protein